MASPPDSSSLNTPRVCLTAIASAPALRLTVATSAAETVVSAVTTTLPAAVSVYQAIPPTPERATAALTADNLGAPGCFPGSASAAGRAEAEAATTAPRTSRSRAVRAVRPRTELGWFLTGSSRRSYGDLRVWSRSELATERHSGEWPSGHRLTCQEYRARAGEPARVQTPA